MDKIDFVVAYDIFSNKRRRKIQKFLYENSLSYQKSVVEVIRLKKSELKRVVMKLLEFSEKEDLIALFYLEDVIYIGKQERVEFVI